MISIAEIKKGKRGIQGKEKGGGDALNKGKGPTEEKRKKKSLEWGKPGRGHKKGDAL